MDSKDIEWKSEYISYIFSGEKEKAKDLLLKLIPDDKLIYKYFRGLNRDFNTFTKPSLWLCNAYYLNDPFDCAFLVNCCSEGLISSNEAVKQRQQNAMSINLQRTVFLACFSERSDSLLMWGHYANNHRGICVGYSLRELIEDYDCFPVVYDERLAQNVNNTHILKEVLTKYKEWEYENEWRIVRIDEDSRGNQGKMIDFVKPREIILGCKNNDFLWNTRKGKTVSYDEELLLEVDDNKIIKYVEEELKGNCYQYEMCANKFGLRKIIRI